MNLLRAAPISIAVAVAAALSSCGTREVAATPSQGVSEAVMPGKVEDLAAFERFIASRPTPDAFKAHYPDVRLVLPGAIATKELRTDRSRYFAEVDAQGRISGGKFM